MSQIGDKFDKHTTAQEVADAFPEAIEGRYIVVTGVGPGGIGQETARVIATKRPRVLAIAGRDMAKLEQSSKTILEETPDINLQLVEMDLSSLASVRRAATTILAHGDVDVLINNAGVMHCPFSKTEDGFERQFGVNYVGPFVLSNLLLPSMLRTVAPRIVNVSSVAHAWSDIRWDDLDFKNGEAYVAEAAYGQSKTAMMLNSIELAERFGPKLIAISLHPGGIGTPLQRHLTDEVFAMYRENFGAFNEDNTPNMASGIWKTMDEGASTTMVAAFDPRMEAINGSYLADCQLAKDLEEGLPPMEAVAMISSHGKDKASATRLWDLTNKLIGESF